jgi:hypothetical protein
VWEQTTNFLRIRIVANYSTRTEQTNKEKMKTYENMLPSQQWYELTCLGFIWSNDGLLLNRLPTSLAKSQNCIVNLTAIKDIVYNRDQWFWRPDAWHKNLEGQWYSKKNFYKKNHFPKYWVVASIIGFLVHKKVTLTLLRDESFFLWLGRMGYLKIRLFILISKMYIWP